MGDGLLLVFNTVMDAVECCIENQKASALIENLDLRIGIHQGEVVFRDNDVIGDDVNIASRIEPFSAVGGIAISDRVNASIERNPNYKTLFIGKPKLKGVGQKIEVLPLGLKVKVRGIQSHEVKVEKVFFQTIIVDLLKI